MQPTEQQQSARSVDASLLLQMIGERDVTIAVLQRQLGEVSPELERRNKEILTLRREGAPPEV